MASPIFNIDTTIRTLMRIENALQEASVLLNKGRLKSDPLRYHGLFQASSLLHSEDAHLNNLIETVLQQHTNLHMGGIKRPSPLFSALVARCCSVMNLFCDTHRLMLAVFSSCRVALRDERRSRSGSGSGSGNEGLPLAMSNSGQILSFAEKRRLHYCQHEEKHALQEQQPQQQQNDDENQKQDIDGDQREPKAEDQQQAHERGQYREEEAIEEPKQPVQSSWEPSNKDWQDLIVEIETGQWCALWKLKGRLEQLNDICCNVSGEKSFLVPVSNTGGSRSEPVLYVCKTYAHRREIGGQGDEQRRSSGRRNSNEGDVVPTPNVCAIAAFLLFVGLLISLILILVLTKEERDMKGETD